MADYLRDKYYPGLHGKELFDAMDKEVAEEKSNPEAEKQPEYEYKHEAYNPIGSYGFSPLGNLCKVLESEGWNLIRIVPHHQYESIAIFRR